MSAAEWQALADRGYGAWSRGDLDGLLDALTPDLLFRPAGAFPGLGDEYRGHDGMREFWAQIKEPWEEFTIEALRIEPLREDLALIDIRFHGIGRGSGVEVELDFFHVVRRRGDRVAELHSMFSRNFSGISWAAARRSPLTGPPRPLPAPAPPGPRSRPSPRPSWSPRYSRAVATACTHLDQIRVDPPEAVEGCAECLESGDRWVHLRVCLSCGHVGCCDSSPNQHATRHHAESGHPIVRSAQPGEEWCWCYEDEALFVVDFD